MRASHRRSPGGGSQRHAKLGKRPGLKGKAAADAAIEKSKQVLKPDKNMKPPKKAKSY